MQLTFAKSFLLLITSIAPISLVSTPSLAATLGTSQSTVDIDNFSHNTLDVKTITDNFTDKFVTDGFVNTKVDAVARFITNQPPLSANNLSFSQVNGNGREYSGLAQTKAAVIGYDFLVNKDETFSFSFDATLNLATSIDNLQSEVVNVDGTTTLDLYDTTDKDNWFYLDSFILEGNLTTLGNDYLNYDNSSSIRLNSIVVDTAFSSNFNSNKESTKASVKGAYFRTFDDLTNVTLVEVKNNQASVNVPEPSSFLGSLLCIIGMGYKITSKVVRSKVSRETKTVTI